MSTSVSSTGSASQLNLAAAAAAASSKSVADETQDRFLTLLITQLKNQDPLNPLDNAQITSQLAQLSTVNGITQLNNTLLALSGQLDMSQSMQAASLIGKEVLVPGDRIALGNGLAAPFGVDIVSPAANVVVNIADASGVVVRKLDLGDQPVGVLSVAWDGMDEHGRVAPDGAYYATVVATDENKAPLPAGTLTYGKVGSIAYTANGLKLDLGVTGSVGLYDIRKIL